MQYTIALLWESRSAAGESDRWGIHHFQVQAASLMQAKEKAAALLAARPEYYYELAYIADDQSRHQYAKSFSESPSHGLTISFFNDQEKEAFDTLVNQYKLRTDQELKSLTCDCRLV